MNRVVLDCSVVISWLFKDEASASADGLLGCMADIAAVVPQHWFLEVHNAILCAERRGRMTEMEADGLVDRVARLGMVADSWGISKVCASAALLARKHRLTVYDAVHLVLAVRMNASLATLDNDLANAARLENVRFALEESFPIGSS